MIFISQINIFASGILHPSMEKALEVPHNFNVNYFGLNERCARQLSARIAGQLKSDLYGHAGDPIYFVNLESALHWNFFTAFVKPKCFKDDLSFQEVQKTINDDPPFLDSFLKEKDPAKSISNIKSSNKHLTLFLKDNGRVLRANPFISFCFGKFLVTLHEAAFVNYGYELLQHAITSPTRLESTLCYLGVELLFNHKKLDTMTLKQIYVGIVSAGLPTAISYNHMRYLQLLLTADTSFDFACDRIHEVASHLTIIKIMPELLWELTHTLNNPEYLKKIKPSVLNALYRYSTYQTFDEVLFEKDLSASEKIRELPSENPWFYTCELPLLRFIHSTDFKCVFKRKILSLLESMVTTQSAKSLGVQVLEYEMNIAVPRGVGYHSAKLNKTLTFVASRETKGDGINPDTMDFFKGTQYPWLSHAIPLLRDRFDRIEVIGWDEENVDWLSKELIVMGPVWGYTEHISEFKDWLSHIRNIKATTLNGSNFMLWNLNKKYLKKFPSELTIPTIFVEPTVSVNVADLFKKFKTTDLVIKGIVDAGSFGLIKINNQQVGDAEQHIEKLKSNNEGAIIQPFIDMTNGEISIVFNGSILSHCFVKVPAENDFRTQCFYGASTYMFPVDGTTNIPILLASTGENLAHNSQDDIIHTIKIRHPCFNLLSRDVVTALKTSYLIRDQLRTLLKKDGITLPPFLRIDLVPFEGSFKLMEIEGIEPYMMVTEADRFDQRARFGEIDHLFNPQKQNNYAMMVWDWALHKTMVNKNQTAL